jgi:predicted signal transduction protein with EAL and GGDEF domain
VPIDSLGHNLGLVVVAEGVEDQATYDRLASMACDLAQGYYMSRPIPAADLTTWARSLPRFVAQGVGAGPEPPYFHGHPTQREGASSDVEGVA